MNSARGYVDCLTGVVRFRGRTSRETYNNFVWVNSLLLLVAIVAAISLPSERAQDRALIAVLAIGLVFAVATLSASVRRLHDRGYPGSKVWLVVVPFVNLRWIRELYEPGDESDNAYGPPPNF